MNFCSPAFLFYFLPLFLALYFFLPFRNTTLLVGSLFFYAWGEPRFLFLLLILAGFNYAVGRWIRCSRSFRSAVLTLGVGVNLSVLFRWKYLVFFAHFFSIRVSEAALPLGISFFTFQGISYLVDVYRGDVDGRGGLRDFLMYKAMFPQLIAGPIVRYRQVAGEIIHREISNARIWAGAGQFVLGLSQKVLIANAMAVPADGIFAVQPSKLSPAGAWIGIISYSLQILFDFSGYSNMAIGLGAILGFTYPPNFDRPYTARSMMEFWRRWHISLSTWFRDYVYFPLGGNRLSPMRTGLHLGVVFLLCGLWHGAAWTFVVWGAWHGVWLIFERTALGRAWLSRSGQAWLSQGYALGVVLVGWVFFRSPDLGYSFRFLERMAGIGNTEPAPHLWRIEFGMNSLAAMLFGIAFSLSRNTGWPERWMRFHGAAYVRGLVALIGLTLCVASLASGTYSPFLYFRF